MSRPLLERVVGDDEDGQRADVVVASWLDEPRGRTQARIAAGQVLLNDGPAPAKSQRLRTGERIVVQHPPAPEPQPTPVPVPLRWRDEHLAVVAKPAGLVVHAGAGTKAPTLVDVLTAQGVSLAGGDDQSRPGIVHRLDGGTSGLLVVASTPQAHAALSAMFKRHEASRRYWAIVDGTPQPPSATIDAPISRASNNRKRFRVDPGGRPAISHYDVEASPGPASVISVTLETGRTHQVRVHMSAVGHPVSGDRVYGASPVVAERLGLQRPALHAAHLAFAHPITGEQIALDEPLPDDLAAARERLLG